MLSGQKKKQIIRAMALSSIMACPAVSSASGYELSVRLGTSDSNSEGLKYAIDSNDNSVKEGDLGDGSQFRIALAKEMGGLNVNVAYGQNSLSGKSAFDSNPAVSNNCNVDPLQGTYDDCFDNANIKMDTNFGVFDAVVGKSFKTGPINVLPYVGVRYLMVDQKSEVQYNFPGGFESFPTREIDYSGVGLRIGSTLNIPFGSSPFFFKGELAVGKMFTGDREQLIVDRVVNDPTPPPFSVKDDVKPLTIDLALAIGYKIRENISVELGYGYYMISDILDTRDTINPVVPGTLPGSEGQGSKNEDLVASGIYAEFLFAF